MKITLFIKKLIMEIILLPRGQAILQRIFGEIYICVRREMPSDQEFYLMCLFTI